MRMKKLDKTIKFAFMQLVSFQHLIAHIPVLHGIMTFLRSCTLDRDQSELK